MKLERKLPNFKSKQVTNEIGNVCKLQKFCTKFIANYQMSFSIMLRIVP